MPSIRPIQAICFGQPGGTDISSLIAPPYDVLDEASKQSLLALDEHNIVRVDLPYTPPKVVGPDEVYVEAGRTFRHWLREGVLSYRDEPSLFVYQQTFSTTAPGTDRTQTFRRRGVMVNVGVQPCGQSPDGHAGIWAHERTISTGEEDRIRLMRATGIQLSPIFGIYVEPDGAVSRLISEVTETRSPEFYGTTSFDSVRHEIWSVNSPEIAERMTAILAKCDIYIADGHHRYNTAVNYLNEQRDTPIDDPARYCMFVLVAMQDPGMIVLPTHRVLSGMGDYSFAKFVEASRGQLDIRSFDGDLAALQAALPTAGPHAIGLYDPEDGTAIATTVQPDPLSETHPDASEAWRQLDVAIAAHLIVGQICDPNFKGPVKWLYPQKLTDMKSLLAGDDFQLGLVMQPTPLESVVQISKAGELMPAKSTFFYPKIATGLVMNSLKRRQEL